MPPEPQFQQFDDPGSIAPPFSVGPDSVGPPSVGPPVSLMSKVLIVEPFFVKILFEYKPGHKNYLHIYGNNKDANQYEQCHEKTGLCICENKGAEQLRS